jgi:4-hydroxy-4-methyl-2-oxoglutarate aldolase
MVPFLAIFLAFASGASAQVFQFTREQLVQYTAKNPYERFADGRPKVPDSLLEKVKALAAEDIFGVLPGAGYPNQWEGGFRILHPGTKLVGRAVTAQCKSACHRYAATGRCDRGGFIRQGGRRHVCGR